MMPNHRSTGDVEKPLEYEAKVSLVIFDDENPKRRDFIVTPSKPVSIGRSSKNSTSTKQPAKDNGILTSQIVSRHHCELSLGAYSGELRLHDHGSTHGTFVDDEKLTAGQKKRLTSGDIITLGQAVIRAADTKYHYRTIRIEFTVNKVRSRADIIDLSSPPPPPSHRTLPPTSSPRLPKRSMPPPRSSSLGATTRKSIMYQVPDSSSESEESGYDVAVANVKEAMRKSVDRQPQFGSSSPPEEPLFARDEALPSSTVNSEEDYGSDFEPDNSVEVNSIASSMRLHDDLEEGELQIGDHDDQISQAVKAVHSTRGRISPTTVAHSDLDVDLEAALPEEDEDLHLVHPSRRRRLSSNNNGRDGAESVRACSDTAEGDVTERIRLLNEERERLLYKVEDASYEDELYEDGLCEDELYEDELYEDEAYDDEHSEELHEDEPYDDEPYDDELYNDGRTKHIDPEFETSMPTTRLGSSYDGPESLQTHVPLQYTHMATVHEVEDPREYLASPPIRQPHPPVFNAAEAVASNIGQPELSADTTAVYPVAQTSIPATIALAPAPVPGPLVVQYTMDADEAGKDLAVETAVNTNIEAIPVQPIDTTQPAAATFSHIGQSHVYGQYQPSPISHPYNGSFSAGTGRAYSLQPLTYGSYDHSSAHDPHDHSRPLYPAHGGYNPSYYGPRPTLASYPLGPPRYPYLANDSYQPESSTSHPENDKDDRSDALSSTMLPRIAAPLPAMQGERPPVMPSNPLPSLRAMDLHLELDPATQAKRHTTTANNTAAFKASDNGGALADFQMQLMLLEQQNKKRMMMARQEEGTTESLVENPTARENPQAATSAFKRATEKTALPTDRMSESEQEGQGLEMLVHEAQPELASNNTQATSSTTLSNAELPSTAATTRSEENGALADYRMQLMLTEVCDKRRLAKECQKSEGDQRSKQGIQVPITPAQEQRKQVENMRRVFELRKGGSRHKFGPLLAEDKSEAALSNDEDNLSKGAGSETVIGIPERADESFQPQASSKPVAGDARDASTEADWVALDAARAEIDRATARTTAEAEAMQHAEDLTNGYLAHFLTNGADDESDTLTTMSNAFDEQAKEAEHLESVSNTKKPSAIKRSAESAGVDEQNTPIGPKSSNDMVCSSDGTTNPPEVEIEPKQARPYKRTRFALPLTTPASNDAPSDVFEQTTYGSPTASATSPNQATSTTRSVGTQQATSPQQIAAPSRRSALAQRVRRDRESSAVAQRTGSSFAQTVRPYVIGAVVGGVGMLGALIALPDSFF